MLLQRFCICYIGLILLIKKLSYCIINKMIELLPSHTVWGIHGALWWCHFWFSHSFLEEFVFAFDFKWPFTFLYFLRKKIKYTKKKNPTNIILHILSDSLKSSSEINVILWTQRNYSIHENRYYIGCLIWVTCI